MDLALDDKVALVTGGASGLGRCTAEHLQREGARVVLADLNEAQLEKTITELGDGAAEVAAVTIDVRAYDECRSAVDAAIERFGQLDILVNSAGIGGSLSFFAESEPEVVVASRAAFVMRDGCDQLAIGRDGLGQDAARVSVLRR